MATGQANRQSAAGQGVWVWCPVESDKELQHPSDLPKDAQTATNRWVENKRGPQLAKISPATLLETKGSIALIAEQGATREVPKSTVLPWYEGLLLLEHLENTADQAGHLQAGWRSTELQKTLEQERAKFKNLSGALYTEKRLMNTSVTGASFVDRGDKEWQYRRENVKGDDRSGLVDGEDSGQYFRIKEVIGYLPPWEAFTSERCGFYQDFYLVRWEHPYSEVDYSKVENGSTAGPGATWEADECLPAQLDPMRVASKKQWIVRQKDQEEKNKLLRQNSTRSIEPSPSPKDNVKRALDHSDDVAKRIEVNQEVTVPPKPLKKLRRDGEALARDLFDRENGHDFAPEKFDGVANIRKGWPRTAEEYPKGYGVANPPGFCWADCDCMDDQRPQHAWETCKRWLEDKTRLENVLSGIELFSAATHLVRRRGQVSKMCFFETAQDKTHDQVHPKAAIDLAGSISRRIMEVCKEIPIESLQEDVDFFFPSSAFAREDQDCEPLHIECRLATGGALPKWLQVNQSSGKISVTKGEKISADIPLIVSIFHSEGIGQKAPLTISPRLRGQPLWIVATGNIMARFNSVETCPLDRTVRNILYERLADIYDHKQNAAKQIPLGQWMRTATTLVRMLRSSAVAHITPSAENRRRAGR